MPKWCNSSVIAKKVWAPGLFTLTINAPEVLPFEPGQFLHLSIERDEKRVNRSYSVASPHSTDLEFFIVLVEDGELTPQLWDLDVGDKVDVSEKAAGRFTLDKSPEAENLWLVSTGTGLAPYIAMLRTDEPWQKYQNICVVHGVRRSTDLAYTEELNSYSKKYGDRFTLIQALTREEPTGDVLKGRIPQLLQNGTLEQRTGHSISPENSTFLLCGNPAMLDDMEEKLGELGLKQHRRKEPGQIVLERYW